MSRVVFVVSRVIVIMMILIYIPQVQMYRCIECGNGSQRPVEYRGGGESGGKNAKGIVVP